MPRRDTRRVPKTEDDAIFLQFEILKVAKHRNIDGLHQTIFPLLYWPAEAVRAGLHLHSIECYGKWTITFRRSLIRGGVQW